MRNVVLHMMVTVDGCVAGPNGELDWLFTIQSEQRDRYVFDLYRSTDGVLVGGATYPGLAEYWPAAETDANSREGDREFARLMNALPKYVFSRSLDKVAWSNSQLLKGDVAEEVARLKQQPGRNLVLTGGYKIAQTFVKLGLIDEYQLIVHPVVLSKGLRLFDVDDLDGAMNLKLAAATPFDAGVVALHYLKA